MINLHTPHINKYNVKSLKGKLLIGSPHIYENDIFSQAIILITEQNAHQTKGLIINQILKNSSINDVIKMMTHNKPKDDYNFPVSLLLGGPMEYNQIHVIHSNDYRNDQTKIITQDIAVTSNLQIIEDIKNDKAPQNYIFVMGHTNWYKTQLEQEIDANNWIIHNCSSDIIFYENNKLKWYMSLQRIGINPQKSHIIAINEHG